MFTWDGDVRRAPVATIVVTVLALAVGEAVLYFGFRDRGSGAAQAGDARLITSAQRRCDQLKENTSVSQDGRTLLVHGASGDSPGTGLDQAGIRCVLDALRAPESVQARVPATRAADGRQEARWAALSASWTYHPDSGLNLVVVAQ